MRHGLMPKTRQVRVGWTEKSKYHTKFLLNKGKRIALSTFLFFELIYTRKTHKQSVSIYNLEK